VVRAEINYVQTGSCGAATPACRVGE